VGAKKDPVWRIVVADQRSPRDGRVIETIGHYNPQTNPSTVVIDSARAYEWIDRGAQPTNVVRKLLRISAAAPAQTQPHEPDTDATDESSVEAADGALAGEQADPEADAQAVNAEASADEPKGAEG